MENLKVEIPTEKTRMNTFTLKTNLYLYHVIFNFEMGIIKFKIGLINFKIGLIQFKLELINFEMELIKLNSNENRPKMIFINSILKLIPF